jgi:Zn-dependent protease with chaperone function
VNTPTATTPPHIEADYFDGRQARAHRVQVHVSGQQLYLRGSGIAIAVPLVQVQWPPTGQRGARLAHFVNGASLQCADGAAWDAWARACGLKTSVVARAEGSWRWVLAAVALLVLLVGGMYAWGLPLLSRGVVALVPLSVDEKVGEVALESLPDEWLEPTRLPAEQQQRLRVAFERVALPGGHIVMTDELVTLVDGREDAIVGVLAHELGHVRHRHGMRSLVQVTVLGAVSSLAFGDFSGLFAGLPVLLGHAGYSRDAEREADGEAIRIMSRAGLSPEAMVVFFEKIGAWADAKAAKQRDQAGEPGQAREESLLGIAFSSHPADAERIARFREAARAMPPATSR